ncbi:Lrp/AsnC family transcriptional regulator [Candidatus Woesearchaeota archaeon]|nr:Lrp/AsnC family transcriptional regulator [Candidatus Woesearchaeota archaeon]
MVKKKDLLLLAYLRENARRHLKEISKKTGVPVSTLHDRIRANAGDCILRNCCLLDFDALGLMLRRMYCLRLKKRTRRK